MSIGGLEAVVTWFAINAVKRCHDVTIVTAKGPSMTRLQSFTNGEKTGKLTMVETVEPSWVDSIEEAHYQHYKEILEKGYGMGQGIVWDNTWHCFPYLSAKRFPKMKIIHTNHGMLEWHIPIKDITYPRHMGLSKAHAEYMSYELKMPVRYVHNGIPLPRFEPNTNEDDENYLLSINRIVREKGIDDVIDAAIRTKNKIKIVGNDRYGIDPSYVNMIKDKCNNSNGYAEYYGLVDNTKKINLIRHCKAVIGCPKHPWMEAFGLYAVEANAYGKPVIALSNGGLKDIVINGVNGFLVNDTKELDEYINRVSEISPDKCRDRVEKYFTDEIMTNNYLDIFEKVLEDDPNFRW